MINLFFPHNKITTICLKRFHIQLAHGEKLDRKVAFGGPKIFFEVETFVINLTKKYC